MQNIMHKRGESLEGDKVTWVLGVDVHEVPELLEIKPPKENAVLRREVEENWSGAGNWGMKKSFYLGRLKGLDSIKKLHEKGWKRGSEKAMELSDGLMESVSQPVGIRRRIHWGDDGDEFDRERLNDGHFDSCWRSSRRAIAPATPIINIAVGWGGNANLSHDQLFWSGASALALIRILENAGYQTSLTAVCANDRRSETEHIAICCRVKQAGEYLRSDAVASIICHAATFRTFLFAAYAAAPFQQDPGLGHNCRVDKVIPACIDSGVLEVPQVILPDTFDRRSAKGAVETALQDLAAANLAALPEELTR